TSTMQLEDWAEGAAVLQQTLDSTWISRPDAWDTVERFQRALDDDLNIAEAVSAFHSMFGGRDAPIVRAWEALEGGSGELGVGYVRQLVKSLPAAPMSPEEALRQWQEGRKQGTYREAWGALHLMDAVLGVVFVPRQDAIVSDIGVFAPGLAADP